MTRVSAGGQRLFMNDIFKNDGSNMKNEEVSKLKSILLRKPKTITPLAKPKVHLEIQPTNIISKSPSPMKINMATSPIRVRRDHSRRLLAEACHRVRIGNIEAILLFISVLVVLTLLFAPLN